MAKLDSSADERRDALAERILESLKGTFDVFTIYIGERLGLYGALAAEPMTAAELAKRTGTNERYIREWLEQQAVTGILEVADAAADPAKRSYRMPPGHGDVLVDRDSLDYMAPIARLAVGATYPLQAVLKAFRSGGGVPYGDYGVDLREGQGDVNRATFLKLLGTEWLPSMADVHERLSAPSQASIADVGCGVGWSSIAMALSYPNVRVNGFDLDGPSIERARANAESHGVSDRVTFEACDAESAPSAGRYDLVTAFECIHDLSRPVEVLATMRTLAGEDGAVLVLDERVADEFMGEGADVEPIMYGWSVLHCLPVGMAEQPSAGTGTVMRRTTLEGYAKRAGFTGIETLPVDNLFFRLYRLHP